jgi:hypothetical protein
MTFTAYINHSLPSRLRIRVPSKTGDVDYFARVYSSLGKLPGVNEVRVNHVTGSILLLHDDISLQQLREHAAAEQLFTLEQQSLPNPTVVERFAAGLNGLDRGLRGVTANNVDVRTVVLAGLAGMAVRQIQQGQVMVPAVSLLWYAYQMLSAPRAS